MKKNCGPLFGGRSCMRRRYMRLPEAEQDQTKTPDLNEVLKAPRAFATRSNLSRR